MGVLHAVALLAGAAIVWGTVSSAVHMFLVPRGIAVRFGRVVFIGMRLLFNARMRLGSGEYLTRDRIMSVYAPASLLVLGAAWVVSIAAGFTLVFWALGATSASTCAAPGGCRTGIVEALELSGSSLLTLGFDRPDQLAATVVSFVEAGLGLGIVALFITYLPTIYGAFTRREALIALLEALAGAPVSPVTLLLRHHVVTGLDELETLWTQWRLWFADVEESHTSISAVVFFRSPVPERSWVTAAGCVLDAAAIRAAAIDLPRSPNAEFCIRAGYVTLRRIADFYGMAYDPDPQPGDPVSVTREEFDAALERLARRGVPVVADRDQAWIDYAGWRVNYDAVLLQLCALTMAPSALWSGDRQPPFRRPPLFRRHTGYSRAAMQEPR